MTTRARIAWLAGAPLTAALGVAFPARAELSAEELAKLAQNRVGQSDQPAIPEQHQPQCRPEKGTQNVLNIQPVIPISVNEGWNIITRAILPIIWQPSP